MNSSTVVVTDSLARSLKRQPDTEQGLRDQLLMCFVLNEKLPARVMSGLRASSVDVDARVVVIPPGEQEMPLTDETLDTLRRYQALAVPTGYLLQGSLSNGDLHGGMTTSAIYARVEHLGGLLKVNGKLTVVACYAYQGGGVPQVRGCSLAQAAPPWEARVILPGDPVSLPEESLDTIIGGLADLEGLLGSLLRVQYGGDLAPAFERSCWQAAVHCTELANDLAALGRVVKLLPLHFLLLRLFPSVLADISEKLLFALEIAGEACLRECFAGGMPRTIAEERAVQVCEQLARQEVVEEKLARLQDLLYGMVINASMRVQRTIEGAS